MLRVPVAWTTAPAPRNSSADTEQRECLEPGALVQQPGADPDQDDPDILDAVEGEKLLEVVLDQRVEHADHGRDGADDQDGDAPPRGPGAEPVEARPQQAVHAQLDHHAGHERRNVARCGRVSEREPHVQRNDAGLSGEAEGQQHEGHAARATAETGRGRAPVRERETSGPGAEQHHAGEQAREPGVGHDRVDPAGPERLARSALVQHQQIGGERHQLPRDRERHHVRGQRHQAHRDDEDQVRAQTAPRAARGADRVHRRGRDTDGDDQQEESGERVESQLEAAQRDEPSDLEREGAAEHAVEAERGGADPDERGESVREARHQRRRLIASSRPASNAAGDGGHPGMTASTGITSATPPATA